MALILAIIYLIYTTFTNSSTLWIYDATSFRVVSDAKIQKGGSTTTNSLTLSACQEECISNAFTCLSFTWNGDITSSTATSNCNMYNTRFGFSTGGLDQATDQFGEGDIVYLVYNEGSNYFEKPMDYSDTLGDHLTANALRLNNKDHESYLNQQNNAFDYQQFLLYYRAGIPGYVNNSETQLNNKYSIIKEMTVVDAEDCAKYCTRNKGAIDEELGTRCVSFNYRHSDKSCHLLTFSLDPSGYNIADIPTASSDTPPKSTDFDGWFYYEGLVGAGCWIIQGQCRKWDDSTYQSQQASAGNTFTVGEHIGIIREYAYDPICSRCTNTMDFTHEFEYICLDKAREYHEDYCDNDADSATVAYWAQDGAGTASVWNSWDLSMGCVIDLSEFECIPDQSKYDYTVTTPNTRFEGKKFRDSIGEVEFSAGVDKSYCWLRASAWYEWCELGGQGVGSETVYLNVSWPVDGSFYLEPAIACECDVYGLKVEKEFGMVREYCTRDSTEPFCYREKQQNYWSEPDILCDDLSSGNQCEVGSDSASVEGTGCYLFYPQPISTEKQALTYKCGEGRYDFDSESFTEVNSVLYREVMCAEQRVNTNCAEWTSEDCSALAESIHNSCGNGLEEASEQIIVWYRPSGEIMVFPSFAKPFETTVTRGYQPAAFYTEDTRYAIIDYMPIRNGRWQTWKPTESGNLRQLDVLYKNNVSSDLTCTIWSGVGVTKSIFLNQVIMSVNATDATFVRFPLDNITLTSGDTYTWQITSFAYDPNFLGDLGFIRGNGYSNGIGDLAWDYEFIAWVEGQLETDAQMLKLEVVATATRPWFEIWCIMVIILFLIFMVFLCILHWKRKYDEEQERKEDKKFQAELRQRAMLQAEAERNEKNPIEEEDDYDDYEDGDGADAESVSDYDQHEKFARDEDEDVYEDGDAPDDYDDEELKAKQKQGNLLGAPGDDKYDRVKSYSKNDMPGYEDEQGGDGYEDEEVRKKKKKKKKRKKKHQDADYEEY